VPEGAAREAGLSQTAVLRIWRAFGLQPHRQETFKRWAGAVQGDLYVKEEHDDELNRVTKMATIIDPSSHKVLAKPLHDVVLISVEPGWWTITGWERVIEGGQVRAFQQSWILIPFDMLSATDRMRRE
jgi:hypothetical protein